MGAAFVKRRMQAELGPDWQARFGSFDLKPAAAASLGQVHRADLEGGGAARVQAAISRHAIGRRGGPEAARIRLRPASPPRSRDRHPRDRQGDRRAGARGARLPPRGEACCALLRGAARRARSARARRRIRDLSTRRLLTLGWLEGEKILAYSRSADRNSQPSRRRDVQGVVASLQPRGRDPRRSASRQLHGVLRRRRARGINLLDYGCIRIFRPRFVGGVVDLYHGLLHDDRARIVHAYETWGFRRLSAELIDILNIWARFIYGPLLDDRLAHRRGRRCASGLRTPAGLPGPPGAEGEGPGRRAARIRLHGPRRGRPRRACSCTLAPS